MPVKKHTHWFKLLFLLLLVGVGVWPETAVPTAVAQSARDPRFGAVESFWAPGEAAWR